MSVYSIKTICRFVSVTAICAILACAPGGQGAPGKDDEQQRGRKKRDALLGPARASVLLLGTFELHDAVLLFERERKYQATESIEDNLVWLNEPRRVANAHGRNLVGAFDLGEGSDYPGPDALTSWYNQQLRIFANLQRIAGNAEKILVVVDAAHVSLLRHSIEASPRFELVEVNEFLGVPQGAQRQVVPLL